MILRNFNKKSVMNRTLRTLSLILLFFTSISALGGGIALIISPTGEAIEMPLSILEHSPFKSFLIPGIILIVMNGLLSVLFAVYVIRKSGISGWLVLVQGSILIGWIMTQIVMIREYAPVMHTLYLAVGVGLGITGILILKSGRT
jgi:hypothetical protein